MLIDKMSGAIRFADKLTILPTLTKEELEQLLSGFTKRSVHNSERDIIWFKIHDERGVRLRIGLLFVTEQLREVTMKILFENENLSNSCDERVMHEEMERKELHDKFLVSMLGDDRIDAYWGELKSVYDEKSGSSYILIRYNGQQQRVANK